MLKVKVSNIAIMPVPIARPTEDGPISNDVVMVTIAPVPAQGAHPMPPTGISQLSFAVTDPENWTVGRIYELTFTPAEG
jgi:hypothetical protein